VQAVQKTAIPILVALRRKKGKYKEATNSYKTFLKEKLPSSGAAHDPAKAVALWIKGLTELLLSDERSISIMNIELNKTMTPKPLILGYMRHVVSSLFDAMREAENSVQEDQYKDMVDEVVAFTEKYLESETFLLEATTNEPSQFLTDYTCALDLGTNLDATGTHIVFSAIDEMVGATPATGSNASTNDILCKKLDESEKARKKLAVENVA